MNNKDQDRTFCKKRNEKIPEQMPEDYCVDCKFFEILENCWVNELEVKYIDGGEDVIELPARFKVYKTAWGAYTTDRKDNLLKAFFKDGQELDLQNLNVIIHDNGIEFLD